uniref:Uncharacterized protein n=1 Tax=Arundo donax TaxID=35708 RepID=A0A0A9FLY6_ARUDO
MKLDQFCCSLEEFVKKPLIEVAGWTNMEMLSTLLSNVQRS